MKTLTIELSENDINNVDHILPYIAQLIEQGYVQGIDQPVNWYLSNGEN